MTVIQMSQSDDDDLERTIVAEMAAVRQEEEAYVNRYWMVVISAIILQESSDEHSIEAVLDSNSFPPTFATEYRNDILAPRVGNFIKLVATHVFTNTSGDIDLDQLANSCFRVSKSNVRTQAEIELMFTTLWDQLRHIQIPQRPQFESRFLHPRADMSQALTRDARLKFLTARWDENQAKYKGALRALGFDHHDVTAWLGKIESAEGLESLFTIKPDIQTVFVSKENIENIQRTWEDVENNRVGNISDELRLPSLRDQVDSSRIAREEYECNIDFFIEQLRKEVSEGPSDEDRRRVEKALRKGSDEPLMRRSISPRMYSENAKLPDEIHTNSARCWALVTDWQMDAGDQKQCSMGMLLIADVGGVFGHPRVREAGLLQDKDYLIYRGTKSFDMFTTRPCYAYAIKDYRSEDGSFSKSTVDAAILAYQINKASEKMSQSIDALYRHYGASFDGPKVDIQDIQQPKMNVICLDPWQNFVRGGENEHDPGVLGHEMLYVGQEKSLYAKTPIPAYSSTLGTDFVSNEHPFIFTRSLDLGQEFKTRRMSIQDTNADNAASTEDNAWKDACTENPRNYASNDDSDDGVPTPMNLSTKRKVEEGDDDESTIDESTIDVSQRIMFTEAYEPEWSRVVEYERLQSTVNDVLRVERTLSYHSEAYMLTPNRIYDGYAREFLQQLLIPEHVYKEVVVWCSSTQAVKQQPCTYAKGTKEIMQREAKQYLASGMMDLDYGTNSLEDYGRLVEFIGVSEFAQCHDVPMDFSMFDDSSNKTIQAWNKKTIAWWRRFYTGLDATMLTFHPGDVSKEELATLRKTDDSLLQTLTCVNFVRSRYRKPQVRMMEPQPITRYRFALMRIGDEVLLVIKSFRKEDGNKRGRPASKKVVLNVVPPPDTPKQRPRMDITIVHPSRNDFVGYLKTDKGAYTKACIVALKKKIDVITKGRPVEGTSDGVVFDRLPVRVYCANSVNIHPPGPSTYETQLDAACVRLDQISQLPDVDDLWNTAMDVVAAPLKLDIASDRRAILNVHTARIACGRRVVPPSLPIDLSAHSVEDVRFNKWMDTVYSPVSRPHLPRCGFVKSVFDMLRIIVELPGVEGDTELACEPPPTRF